MSGTRAGWGKGRQRMRDIQRDRYQEAVGRSTTAVPRWEAFISPAACDFGEACFVEVEPFNFRPGMDAVSLTRTPRGDAFGIADLEVALLVKLPKHQQEMRKVNARIQARCVDRQPCEVCGASPAEGHHDDYDKPLELRWLCRTHHDDLHHPERLAA